MFNIHQQGIIEAPRVHKVHDVPHVCQKLPSLRLLVPHVERDRERDLDRAKMSQGGSRCLSIMRWTCSARRRSHHMTRSRLFATWVSLRTISVGQKRLGMLWSSITSPMLASTMLPVLRRSGDMGMYSVASRLNQPRTRSRCRPHEGAAAARANWEGAVQGCF